MKKVISFVLTIALLCSIYPHAFAYNEKASAASVLLEPITQKATSIEMSEYDVYVPDFSEGVTAEDILDQCQVVTKFVAGGIQYTTYTSKELNRYLVDCASINEILGAGDNIYIDYLTTEGNRVFLCYSSKGYENTTVQSAEDDITYFFEDGTGIKYELGHYAMSETLEKKIDEYIQNGEIEKLRSLNGIITHVDDNGNVIIEEAIDENSGSASTRSTANPTGDSELLASLKLDFPMQENVPIGNYSKYCDALGKNISIKVTQNRDSYVKKTADWGTFVATTALTVITYAMGFASATVTITVLTAMGVGISLGQQIETDVSLCKSAHFTFYGSRVGYAYDSTVYNDLVRVIEYYNKGGFAGGYDKNGEFTWIIDDVPAAYEKTAAEIADKTIYNYNSDVAVHNSCTLYFPDWV